MKPGDVMSYSEMCVHEKVSLQRGMNYRLNGGNSIILMSRRPGAPYLDLIEEDGRVLIYEGHDVPRTRNGPNPKKVNQLLTMPNGKPTQNGLFFRAAKARGTSTEQVRVYEKIRAGIWVYNGLFELLDAWTEEFHGRSVIKFKLRLCNDQDVLATSDTNANSTDDRIIPSSVKLEVWKRDKGRCLQCGSTDRLHFDHIIPYSKGGSSKDARNIQILCERHNLMKHDHIR